MLDFPANPVDGQVFGTWYWSSAYNAWRASTANSNLGSRVTALEVADATTNMSGLVPVVPSSVAVGSGSGSVGTNGFVSFSGATSIRLNGIFTSGYMNYRIVVSGLTSGSAGIVQLFSRLASGGTDSAGSTDYVTDYMRYYGGGNANGASTGQSAMGLGYISTGGETSTVMDIQRPFTVSRTNMLFTGTNYQSDIATYIYITGSNNHKLSSSFDGFTLLSDSGGLSGYIQVYGYR